MVTSIFECGEIRKFDFNVRSSVDNETIIVTNASFRILRDSQEVFSGDCQVTGTLISILIPMTECGIFTLEITATIPPETIIERVNYRVIE